MNTRRHVLLALLAGSAVLAGCASPQVSDYAQQRPKLELDRYFNGRIRAHGIFQKRGGEVVRRFTSDPAGRLTMRSDSAGNEFVTDGGHLILDASFGLISDANALSAALLDIAGVVQHGLFLNMCETAFVATQSGIVVKQR